jgi:general secretion pathway protein K
LPAAGYALVLVLWTLALLALAVSSFVHAQRVETTLVGLHQQTARARALTESGIWLAIARFFDGEGLVEPVFSAMVDGTSVALRIRPVNAKINLNSADASALDSALASIGVPDGQRVMLVARILDWRDADTEAGARGLEDSGYAGLGLPYGAKDAPFYTVDELRYVPGVEEAVYRRLSPLLTVFGADGAVDAAFASREVLAALPGVTSSSSDDRSPPPGLERGGTFEIESAAELADARSRTVAVVEIARGQDPPFKIAAWTSAGDAL